MIGPDLPLDPLPLAQALIRCASVTPKDAGAQAILADTLERLGFAVTRLRFGEIENLYARIGTSGPHLCFAGHTDVVPQGDGPWSRRAFDGEVHDGVLYGRGACDMKGAIAAFVAGCAAHLAGPELRGSISLLITGDEEGPAVDGTVRVLEWMERHGQQPDFCLVGEPTNPGRLGEVIKIGRRGSLNARIRMQGVQGHVAYPAWADNPVHRLLRALGALTAAPLDGGNEWFEPSGLQVTSIDVGNAASNVIPSEASARLNIRFNDRHSGASPERLAAGGARPACGAVRPRDLGQRRELPYCSRGGGADLAGGGATRDRPRAEAGHQRRHVGRALHRPALPGRRVRTGGRHHAPGGRTGAGRRIARPRRHLSRRARRVRRSRRIVRMTRHGPLAGLLRLARFRADGLAHFEGSPRAFLDSLAPLVGFTLAAAVLMLMRGAAQAALTDVLVTLILLLAPAVISEAFARHWDREAAWAKFAVAFNWCQWTVPIVLVVCLLLSGVLVAVGWSRDQAIGAAAIGVVAYGLSLHWFLSRHALQLSHARSLLLVLAMNFGAGLLAFGPPWLASTAADT